MICNSKSTFYFSKKFVDFDIGIVEYFKCTNCNFVFSKTHIEMDNKQWERLNFDYHNRYFKNGYNSDDPRWIKRLKIQIDTINDLDINFGIIPHEKSWIDYACGSGILSTIANDLYGYNIKNFDKYINKPHYH